MKTQGKSLSPSSFSRDTLWYGVAVLAERLCSFLMIPVLTKNLNQELYGIWTQIIVTIGLLSPILLTGFCSAVVRFLAGEEHPRRVSAIFHWMLAVVFAIFLFIFTGIYLFRYHISEIMFGSTGLLDFVWLFAAFLMSDTIFEFLVSFLRARKEIKLASLYYFLKNASRLFIFVLGILMLRIEFLKLLWIMFVLQLAVLLFIYLKDTLKKIGPPVDFSNIPSREILAFSLPLVPYAISIWGSNFSNRYFIVQMLGMEQLSIYALSYSLAAVLVIFYSVLGFTLYPHLTQLWARGDKGAVAALFHKTISHYLFFSVPIMVLLAMLNNPLIRIISTSQYLAEWQVIFYLLIAIAIFGFYQLHIFIMLLKNKTLLIFLTSLLALILNIILNIILIPAMGISGAAIALLISNSVLAILTVFFSRRYIDYTFPWQESIRILAGGLLMFIFLVVTRHFLDTEHLAGLAIALSGALAVYAAFDCLGKKSFLRSLILEFKNT